MLAVGLPALSLLPFSNPSPNLFAKLAPFSDPRQIPEKGSLSFHLRQCPNWGIFWDPNLGSRFGAQVWAHLAMFFCLLACVRCACNSPRSYAWPTRGHAGFGRDICLMDQFKKDQRSSQPCFMTSTWQLRPWAKFGLMRTPVFSDNKPGEHIRPDFVQRFLQKGIFKISYMAFRNRNIKQVHTI